MAFLALNVWTGSPLLAVWLGSRVQGEEGQPSMTALVVVIVSLVAFSLALYQLLKLTMRAYQEATGSAPTARTHAPGSAACETNGGTTPRPRQVRRAPSASWSSWSSSRWRSRCGSSFPASPIGGAVAVADRSSSPPGAPRLVEHAPVAQPDRAAAF
jgi:hypothetical protein